MIENRKILLDTLNYIGDRCDRHAIAYLIGGSAMLWHNLKDTTKDVDLCMSYESTNTLVSGIRPFGFVEHKKGVADVDYLHIILPKKKVIVQVFMQSIYSIEDFNRIEQAECEELNCGNLLVKIPDAKTLVALKDIQTHALYKEYKRLREIEMLCPHIE